MEPPSGGRWVSSLAAGSIRLNGRHKKGSWNGDNQPHASCRIWDYLIPTVRHRPIPVTFPIDFHSK
ncbi:hypothetical protein SJA_C1-08690 [Sphingobium indicum UT26S]|uniref:Uncharacterized protein n=1 Tax=Sphingobium indicum (strain DSM 16413 / CCM 7287 / MTCC 6362 / UT26 / NBRC 101211 / UT26S) TaxID=452662 RepID=D4YZC1_SPHIU|nr:hypothetical protein SJA_C1-08690 [Sphingobium indicum UT26S]